MEAIMLPLQFKAGLAATAALLCTSSALARTITIPFSASNFSDPLDIDNPYFPLVPGIVQTYKAETKDGCEVEVFTVTDQTRVIAGVTTRVIHDQAFEGETCTTDPSALVEDTLDYHAQDDAGNVWYFGEDSFPCPIFTCPRNSGSWIAGEDPADALPGIIMLANPRSGDTYLQEQAPGVAEDQATVTSTGVSVTLKREDAYPPGTFSNCIKTKEFSDLEKGSTEFKYYCPNIGNVMVEEHHGSVFISELTAGPDPLRFRTVPKQ
jgi:hypothetical protein